MIIDEVIVPVDLLGNLYAVPFHMLISILIKISSSEVAFFYDLIWVDSFSLTMQFQILEDSHLILVSIQNSSELESINEVEEAFLNLHGVLVGSFMFKEVHYLSSDSVDLGVLVDLSLKNLQLLGV